MIKKIMMAIFVTLVIGILSALLIGLSIGTDYLEAYRIKTSGKAKENARTVVYEESQSYNTGKKQELAKYYYEYTKAETTEQKDAIMKVVKMSFAEYDSDKIKDDDMRDFLNDCREK